MRFALRTSRVLTHLNATDTAHLIELNAVSQCLSIQDRAGQTKQGLERHAKDLDTRDPRSTVHAEIMPSGIKGKHVALALAVGRLASSLRVLSRYAIALPVNFLRASQALQLLSYRGDVDVQVKYHDHWALMAE